MRWSKDYKRAWCRSLYMMPYVFANPRQLSQSWLWTKQILIQCLWCAGNALVLLTLVSLRFTYPGRFMAYTSSQATATAVMAVCPLRATPFLRQPLLPASTTLLPEILYLVCVNPANHAALVLLLPIKPHVLDRKRRRQGIRLRERPSQCWGCLWVWSCLCYLLKGTSGGLVHDERKLSEDEPTYLKDQLCFIQVVIMIFDMYRSLLLCRAHGAKGSCVAWRFLVGMFLLSRWWGQHRPSSQFY